MKAMRKTIRLGTHGEQYGNWMPVSMLSLMGGLLALAAALAALCFAAFHWNVLGVLFTLAALALAVALCWFAWMRRQFAFGSGGIMEQVHQTVLSHLDFDGKGQILDVGCGSGALSIRAALVWPQARVLGIDAWPPAYNYSQRMCEKNAESEGVAVRCRFQRGDANKLDFPRPHLCQHHNNSCRTCHGHGAANGLSHVLNTIPDRERTEYPSRNLL